MMQEPWSTKLLLPPTPMNPKDVPVRFKLPNTRARLTRDPSWLRTLKFERRMESQMRKLLAAMGVAFATNGFGQDDGF